MSVDLYEDNAGGLYLAHCGRAWELGWLGDEGDGRFAEDAETLVAGQWDPHDNLPAVSLVKLEDQTHLTADATQHIATWASGMVTLHSRPGGAAACYLGENAD